jgi:hypothetical protein
MRPFKKEKSMARAKHLSFCRIQLVQFYICRFFGAPILTGIDVHTPFCRTLTPFLTTVACTKSRSTRMAGKSLDIYIPCQSWFRFYIRTGIFRTPGHRLWYSTMSPTYLRCWTATAPPWNIAYQDIFVQAPAWRPSRNSNDDREIG